jgi:hypothetical protein
MPAFRVDLPHRISVGEAIAHLKTCDIGLEGFLAGWLSQIRQRVYHGGKHCGRMPESSNIIEVQRMRKRSICQCRLDSVGRYAEADDARLGISADELEVIANDGGKLGRRTGYSDPGTVEYPPFGPFNGTGRDVFKAESATECSAS